MRKKKFPDCNAMIKIDSAIILGHSGSFHEPKYTGGCDVSRTINYF